MCTNNSLSLLEEGSKTDQTMRQHQDKISAQMVWFLLAYLRLSLLLLSAEGWRWTSVSFNKSLILNKTVQWQLHTWNMICNISDQSPPASLWISNQRNKSITDENGINYLKYELNLTDNPPVGPVGPVGPVECLYKPYLGFCKNCYNIYNIFITVFL